MIVTTRTAEYMGRVTRDALEASFTFEQLSDIKAIDYQVHSRAKENIVRDHTVCFPSDKEDYALKIKAYYELYGYKCSMLRAPFSAEYHTDDCWHLRIEW